MRRADRIGESSNSLAARYIEEGLRMDDHPLIRFRDGAAGRRAALAGTRLDVWQVVETLRNSESSLERTAEYLSVPPAWVQASVRYYAAYRDEVDNLAERERAAAEHEEELWRAQQAVLS
ncbi:MAG: ribbon-helix-helix protein, CopG family [Gaiellaceae bacterium]